MPLRAYADQTLPKSLFCYPLLSQSFQFTLRRKYSNTPITLFILPFFPFPSPSQEHNNMMGMTIMVTMGNDSVPVGYAYLIFTRRGSQLHSEIPVAEVGEQHNESYKEKVNVPCCEVQRGGEGRERGKKRTRNKPRQKDEVSLVLSAGSLYHQHSGMAHPHKQLLYLVSSCLSP